jgi:hypothetical protein
MRTPDHEVLEAGRIQADMTVDELWVAYVGLGGGQLPHTLRAYLAGEPTGPVEYDLVAQAINERFIDRGQNHPVPYHSELR